MCLFSLLFFVFLVVVFVLALCFWLLCFSRSPWNHIISVHYEPEAYYSIGFYCRIHTASKYLHNDLARAIRRWSKKKNTASTQYLTRSQWQKLPLIWKNRRNGSQRCVGFISQTSMREKLKESQPPTRHREWKILCEKCNNFYQTWRRR